jgi:hypothetical protein
MKEKKNHSIMNLNLQLSIVKKLDNASNEHPNK